MCIVEAGYFVRNGSGMPGPCTAGQNDQIGVEIIASIETREIGKRFAGMMRIRRPDGATVDISTAYRQMISETETFSFTDWAKPIPAGTYQIVNAWLIDESGNVPCEGTVSGGFCQSLTVSAPAPICDFGVS